MIGIKNEKDTSRKFLLELKPVGDTGVGLWCTDENGQSKLLFTLYENSDHKLTCYAAYFTHNDPTLDRFMITEKKQLKIN